MTKDNLLEIILGTIGGILFSIGMCMGLIKEWNLLIPGIIVGIIGFIFLLSIISIYIKNHPNNQKNKNINTKLVIAIIIAIVGALIMGFGMSMVMVGEPSQTDLIIGIIVGIVGLVICVLDFPVYTYLKQNK